MASSKANLRALMAQERARKVRSRPDSSEEEPRAKVARLEPPKPHPTIENESTSSADPSASAGSAELKSILRRAEHRTTVRKTVRFADAQPTVHLIEKSPPINTPLSPFQELIRAAGVPHVMRTVNEAKDLCTSAQLKPTEIMESIRMELKDLLAGPRPPAADERNRKFYDMYWCLSEFLEAQMALAELSSSDSPPPESVHDEVTDVPSSHNPEETMTIMANEEEEEEDVLRSPTPQSQQEDSPVAPQHQFERESVVPETEVAISNENHPLGTTGESQQPKSVDSAPGVAITKVASPPENQDLEAFIAEINVTTREAVMADQDEVPTEQSVLRADKKRETDLREVTVSIDQEIRDLETRAFRGTQPKEFLSRLEARTQSAVANSKIASSLVKNNSKAAAVESRESSAAETVDDLDFLVDDESWRMWDRQ